MDSQRVIIAVVLSLGILVVYQYFFIAPQQAVPVATEVALETGVQQQTPPVFTTQPETPLRPAVVIQPGREGRDIPVETNLFSAVISETGGGVKSFKLKKYREKLDAASDIKQLILTQSPNELPLYFTWGLEDPARTAVPVYKAVKNEVRIDSGKDVLQMSTVLPSGVEIVRTFTFHGNDYLIQMEVDVVNRTEHQVQGAPSLSLTNKRFSNRKEDHFLFNGPALFANNELEEIKVADLEKKGPQSRTGELSWIAYEGTYFMCGLLPGEGTQSSVSFSSLGEDKISTMLTSNTTVLQPGEQKHYSYGVYFGPKKLAELQKAGSNLEKIVNFGWFDVMAKPVLRLLIFLNGYVHNYGLAIILVTILIKAAFWPIAQKGMKSMKTMQKLQPKMAKLREKYANDKEQLNREMVQLYKTYKVNPVGGCLPMLLQIPVFFALYKVLLQTIELRHAPFMLWITDLSAPDRLPIGIDIPYLGGIPVLTLLMGGSMFLQQKMTPTTGDPTQAKIMMFLPIVFTFMFINFASGLVLYWFMNNLLSIAQQYAINRQVD
ncbi:MAG: membrane protein insertase YidC [Thermodesulfobacteriota bacterium]|nr:membrane protein insertase YidC [Thermodesulfobacteriota bacterium]